MGPGKWIAAGATLAALLAALVLVGGDDSSLADAAERIEGESMRQRIEMRYGDATGQYEITGEGVVAADNSRGVVDMRVSMKGEPGERRIVLRNIGDEYWFRVPAFEHVLPKGKPWVHSVDNQAPGTMLTPSEFAEFLSQADEVSEVGEEEIRGMTATKFQGVIDLEELADEIGGETKDRIEQMLEREDLPDNARPGVGIDAYISEDGLPIRLRMWGGESDNDSFDMITDILEYGVPVDVEQPPASSVIEEDEFNRLTGG